VAVNNRHRLRVRAADVPAIVAELEGREPAAADAAEEAGADVGDA